jgi:hypothetical protein
MLEERTYIVVGILAGKSDIEDKFGLNGKNLYVLFLSNCVLFLCPTSKVE